MYDDNTPPDPATPIKTWALSIDFDGCTNTAEARARLIQRITDVVRRQPDLTTIDIYIGSYRQSVYADFHAAYIHNGIRGDNDYFSCKVLGQDFIDDLRRSLQTFETYPEVTFNPLLSGDIYNHLKDGTQFKIINQSDYAEWSQKIRSEKPGLSELTGRNQLKETIRLFAFGDGIYHGADSRCSYETSKTLLLYLQMHTMAIRQQQLHPNEKFIFSFFDDKCEILDNLVRFFAAHPELLPDNCSFQAMPFESRPTETASHTTFPLIHGTGAINFTVANDLRTIAAALEPAAMANDGLPPLDVVQAMLLAHVNRLVIPVTVTPFASTDAKPTNTRAKDIAALKKWSDTLRLDSHIAPPLDRLQTPLSLKPIMHTDLAGDALDPVASLKSANTNNRI